MNGEKTFVNHRPILKLFFGPFFGGFFFSIFSFAPLETEAQSVKIARAIQNLISTLSKPILLS